MLAVPALDSPMSMKQIVAELIHARLEEILSPPELCSARSIQRFVSHDLFHSKRHALPCLVMEVAGAAEVRIWWQSCNHVTSHNGRYTLRA